MGNVEIPRVELCDEDRLHRLQPPEGPVRMVLDTDTYNEIDDQFALVYAMLSPHIEVEAVYAAPFHNSRSDGPRDGMEKSYEEIVRLLSMLDRKDPEAFAFRGAKTYLDEGLDVNAASKDLVARAKTASPDDPLYVVAIGAPTNVSAALCEAPEIARNIVVVWLGGQPPYWHHAKEFNLQQDVTASRTLFDSGVSLVQIPCQHVAQLVRSSVPELQAHLDGTGDLGEYLLEIFTEYRGQGGDEQPWTKEIWDVAPIGYLIDPEWVPSGIQHSPILTDELTYSHDQHRHLIRVADTVYRDPIFADLFELIEASPY